MPIDASQVVWDSPDPAAVKWDDEKPKQKAPERSLSNYVNSGLGGLTQQTKDALGGLVRGAGSIGATLLAPNDLLNQYLLERAGQKPGNLNAQRRQDMTAATQSLGANPESLTYGGFKLGGEVAGTAGVGPALAGLTNATRLGPMIPNVIKAIETAGMSGSGIVPRAIGGGITGGLSAGLVNPEDAKKGAMVGGALPVGMKVAGEAGKLAGKALGGFTTNVLGLTTGVGSEPIKEAFKAGRTKSADFLDNMRGDVPLTDVLDEAKRGLEVMRTAKSAEYRSGMVPIKNDKSVLNFADIDKGISEALNVATFKGQVKNERAFSAIEQMKQMVDEWKKLDPAQFHTPEGLDALKQRLGGVMESIPFQERTARLAAGKVYASAKSTIEEQAPTYAKVMKDYSAASDQITEIERALSLGQKASADTSMRKLQSLMRNNVQTNYGNRLDLARSLEQQGNVNLMPQIAGQALNSWTPRSLSGQIGSGATLLGSAMAGNPLPLLGLPLQSPRLVGGAAYGMGRLFPQAAPGAPGMLGGPGATSLLTAPGLEQFGYRAAPVLMADR